MGIGGATAEVVGRLLHNLGQRAQVISVTHQPQVAAQADQHFLVAKYLHQARSHTEVNCLSQAGRLDELSRMLGGVDITDATRQHAQDMLDRAASATLADAV